MTNDTLKLAIDKGITKTSEHRLFEMKEKVIPFYLKKGDWLFSRGRIEETFDAREEVLKANPDN